MPTRPRAASGRSDEALFAAKPSKVVPHAFVLDELAELAPETRPMFGCTAIYVGEKIVAILRDRPSVPRDNGVWLATTPEHHVSLLEALPSMRSISVLGPGVTGWQNLPADDLRFEEDVLAACALIVRRDPRIGKVPASKKPKGPRASPAKAPSPAKKLAKKAAKKPAKKPKPGR